MIFDDEVFGVGDVGLFKDPIRVLADEKGPDMILKSDLRGEGIGHQEDFVGGFGRIQIFLILPSLEKMRGVLVLAASSQAC